MAGSRNDTHYSSGYNLLPTDAAAISLMQMETTGVQFINVDGPPNGNEAANPGSIACDRTNGNLWKKQSGTGNTGWEQIASGDDVATQYTTDSGVAVPVANNINLLGQNLAGSGIQTTASGSTVTHRMLSPYSLAGFSFTGGDVVVTRSDNGNNVNVLVANTSNTANSGSFYSSRVAGASAGDPHYRLSINGIQQWAMGIDNSDSDAWTLTNTTDPGFGNVIHATIAGEINYPLQPAFSAYVNSSVADVTGDGTVYKIIPDVEVFDQNADFDVTTGIFTAPVTGRYCFNYSCTIGTGTIISVANMNINSSNNNYLYGMSLSVNLATTNAKGVATQLLDMDAADTVIFTVVATDSGGKIDDVLGTTTSQIRTSVSGYLVC